MIFIYIYNLLYINTIILYIHTYLQDEMHVRYSMHLYSTLCMLLIRTSSRPRCLFELSSDYIHKFDFPNAHGYVSHK